MGMIPELAGGILGSVGGSMTANAMGGSQADVGKQITDLVNQMNGYLQNGLTNAISSSTNYTNQGNQQLNQSLGSAIQAMTGGTQGAAGLENAYTNYAFNLGQQLLAPYEMAGQNALNAYEESLGMPRTATPQNQANALQTQIQHLQSTMGNAPTAPTGPMSRADYMSNLSDSQLLPFIQQHISAPDANNLVTYNGPGQTWSNFAGNDLASTVLGNDRPALEQAYADANYNSYLQQAQAQHQNDLNNYQNQLNGYNSNQQQLQNLQNQYNQINQAGIQPPSNPANAPYYYQGENPNIANNPAFSYENTPGFQYLVQQSLRNVNNNSAAKGLLESGQTQRDLLTTANGLQNQYFNNYQQQLSNLAGMGSQLTGASTAASLFPSLGNTIGSQLYGTGSNIGQANLSTGQNIAGLLANQGVLNANAYLNTYAAMANNLMRGSELGMQLQSQQNSANSSANAMGMFGGGGGYGGNLLSGGSGGGNKGTFSF